MVFNHLHNNFSKYDLLDKNTYSRKVGENDVLMFFPNKKFFVPLREKMATWENIKAPETLEKLPAYGHILRIIKLLLMLNKNRKELSLLRFDPRFKDMRAPTNAEISACALDIYIVNILKRKDLLLVYKDSISKLFKRELCHMIAIGYKEFCKETKIMFPESFYMDGKAHYKCFNEEFSRQEKIDAAKKTRRAAKKKIIEDVIKKAISPNVIKQYFNPRGGHKEKLLDEINERLAKKGFDPLKDKSFMRWKSEIFKENDIKISELYKADKELYKEHVSVRSAHTNKRMTLNERLTIIRFVLEYRYPFEYEILKFYRDFHGGYKSRLCKPEDLSDFDFSDLDFC